jgi:hypothetical protein
LAEGREISLGGAGQDLHQRAAADVVRRIGRHGRQAGERLLFRFAVRALDARVEYEKNPPVRREIDMRDDWRDFGVRAPSGVDHQAAALEQGGAGAGSRAALEQARVALRIERKSGQPAKRRSDRYRELRSRPEACMLGDGAGDDEPLVRVETKTLGDLARQARRPLAFFAQCFEAHGVAKLNARLECIDGEPDRTESAAEVAIEIEKAQMQARSRGNPNAFQLRGLTRDRSPALAWRELMATLRNFAPFAKRRTRESCGASHFSRLARGLGVAQSGSARDEAGIVLVAAQAAPSQAAALRVSLDDRWAMIELILTVCALNAPNQCDERRLQFMSQESLMQCAKQAPPYIAAWSGEHPASRVTRWRCAYPGQGGQKT